MKNMRDLIMICEQNVGSLTTSVKETLPSTYVIPELKNNDFYHQYRYGLALASAAAMQADPTLEFYDASEFGENMTVISYAEEEKRIIELAAKLMGVKPKLISTPTSEEPHDTQKNSPVPKQK